MMPTVPPLDSSACVHVGLVEFDFTPGKKIRSVKWVKAWEATTCLDEMLHPTAAENLPPASAKLPLPPRSAETFEDPIIHIEPFVAGPKLYDTHGPFLQKGISELLFHFVGFERRPGAPRQYGALVGSLLSPHLEALTVYTPEQYLAFASNPVQPPYLPAHAGLASESLPHSISPSPTHPHPTPPTSNTTTWHGRTRLRYMYGRTRL